MENHPIPQDVTGFKFKLIGNITVKQFLYCFAAAIISYLLYTTPLFFLIKFPFIVLTAGLGAALAFLPIDGRPLDKMIICYIRLIPKENESIYRKKGVDLYIITSPVNPDRKRRIEQQEEQKKQTLSRKNALLTQLKKSYFKPDEFEVQFLAKLKPLFEEKHQKTTPFSTQQPMRTTQGNITSTPQASQQPILTSTHPASPPTTQNMPQPFQMKMPKAEEAAATVEEKIDQETVQSKPARNPSEPVSPLAKQAPQTIPPPTVPQTQSPQDPPTIAPQKDSLVLAGFPLLPDVPNIVLGIIKDPRGKVLPNIIVEIIDELNNPVRAFKTNSLGQFASATPLPNGTYRVKLDDPQKQHEFATIEIALNGKIFQPLEIISIDAREKLRRELFNANT